MSDYDKTFVKVSINNRSELWRQAFSGRIQPSQAVLNWLSSHYHPMPQIFSGSDGYTIMFTTEYEALNFKSAWFYDG